MSSFLMATLFALFAAQPTEVTDQDFERQCRAAVLDLHLFFEQWFNASIPEDSESLTRFRDVLADDFEYVGSRAQHFAKAELFVDDTWPAHGYWLEEGRRGGKTRVESLRFRRVSETTAIATWEYWQDVQEKDGVTSRGRLDTGIFRLDPSKPHGVAWLHVHETALPEPESD